MSEKITMLHGSGGRATGELIRDIFASSFSSDTLDKMEDAAVVAGGSRIALTTDSFVVDPVIFPGGDIGRLSICGTVNDLLARGADPKYITCGWIIEEGASVDLLARLAHSMAECAKEAGVQIVAGDTKVIEGNGGIYINTAGVGVVSDGVDISAENAKAGDKIIVSGDLGDQHAAILAARMGIDSEIKSDAAPLTDMCKKLFGLKVHTLRDVTRGGLATVLKELAISSKKAFNIDEESIPVSPAVQSFAGMMGLDPLYMGNEGKLVCIVDPSDADEALFVIQNSKYGNNARLIGSVSDEREGVVILNTRIGGRRSLDVLSGEGLPRIC